jgi:putative nucleotidyltransferase with HDIG domain
MYVSRKGSGGGSRRAPVYALVALCVLTAMTAYAAVRADASVQPVASTLWPLMAAMVLVAELMPVNLGRWGVRITFGLPYVAGVASAAGAAAAIATEVVAALVGGLYVVAARGRFVSSFWLVSNVVVAAFSAACGALAMNLVFLYATGHPGSVVAGAFAFLLVYMGANVGCAALLEWLSSSRSLLSALSPAVGVGARSLALYALIASAVVVLVEGDLLWFVPLTLVPVWAARHAFQYRARMDEHYHETITALTQMLQRAHPYTHQHVERVARAAEQVGRRLGLPAHRAHLLREAAILHDIGKIAIDENVLDKPAKLTPEEMGHVRQHAAAGARILAPVPEFTAVAAWIRHHHERPDGQGYPDGLRGEQIPLESRIIAVIDAYDAMTGEEGEARPYRRNMSRPEALAELERCSGSQFDPRVVRVFRAVMEGEA